MTVPISKALGDFRRWMKKAPPGDDYVYHISGDSRSSDLFEGVRLNAEMGDVALFQSPVYNDPASYANHRRFSYHARRLSGSSRKFLSACAGRGEGLLERMDRHFRPSSQPRIGYPTSHLNPTLED
jgi:hypothetical protein